jgi:monofunctional biosynthetic peptidoglycan transglycosylase
MAAKGGTAKRSGGTRKPARARAPERRFRPLRWLVRIALRGAVLLAALALAAVVLFAAVNPPVTHTIWAERQRLGSVDRDWVAIDGIAPVMMRSAVAAEDANFCLHWGFDMDAIRAAMADGAVRGASTISQQTVKNVYLWQGRSWTRKALEALVTPAVEAVWSKRRILEVYLNIAEFGEGVFGVEAAAQHHFGVRANELSARQASLLAAVLPNPKAREAGRPSALVERRARAIRSGAATIAADGRSDCFE